MIKGIALNPLDTRFLDLSKSSRMPNVLIISESPFTIANGFGATLCTLFYGSPTDTIRQLYPIGTYSDVPILRSRAQRIKGMNGMGVGGTLQHLRFRAGFSAAWGNCYSRHWLKRFLGTWKPDVVYCFFCSNSLLNYATWASQTIGCPLALHVADEPRGENTEACLRASLPKARTRIAISEKMASHYSAHYGCDFHITHNGAGDSLLTTQRSRNDNAFVIRYIGSIHPPEYEDSNFWTLESFARAVKTIAATAPQVRLELIGGGSITQKTIDQNPLPGPVSYRAEVKQSELFPLLVNADMLIIPLGFNAAGANRQQYSFSTKLPEYLGSGTPTLVYGPAENATVEYCASRGFDYVVTRLDQLQIEAIIREIISQGAQARKAAEHLREYTRKNLSAKEQRTRFQRILIDSCASS
jgi:glycosyltransferase involved in cell wall biosynthesis